MTQYAKLTLKMPKGETVADLEKELLARGYEVEITGVFIEMQPYWKAPRSFVPKKRK